MGKKYIPKNQANMNLTANGETVESGDSLVLVAPFADVPAGTLFVAQHRYGEAWILRDVGFTDKSNDNGLHCIGAKRFIHQ